MERKPGFCDHLDDNGAGYAYHVTNAVPQILAEGLKPGDGRNYFGDYLKDNCRGRIFVMVSFQAAASWLRDSADGDWQILRITLDPMQIPVDRFRPDPILNRDGHGTAFFVAEEDLPEGVIPPSLLAVI